MRYFLILFIIFSYSFSQKIKDVSNIVGIRDNQLIGYGLVVGLAGTGDKSKFTMQSLQNLLRNAYIKIPASSIQSKNAATVMVTASLPAFSRQGDKIKINVSAIGDSKSIDNGQLLLTELKGVDGNVYALAQGTIIANQANLTTGYVYDGATVENEIDYSLQNEKNITLSLFKNNAKHADLIQQKINKRFGQNIAMALDTRTIDVIKPDNISIVRFISIIQNIPLEESFKKKIIIDLNKEILVSGLNIPLDPLTITRDNFTLRIKKSPLSKKQWDDQEINKGLDIGDEVKIADKQIVDLNNAMINTQKAPTVSDLVRAMKVMKLPFKDIVETLQIIKDMGALNVELEIRR